MPELLLVQDRLDDEVLWLEDILGSSIRGHITVRRGKTEALDYLLDSHEPPPAVIVLDNRPPRLSGVEILNRLRNNEKTRSIPIVLFNGINVDGDPAELLNVDAGTSGGKTGNRNWQINLVSQIAE